jgi:glycosyltransferase involved in cell wall biosynthesis
MRNEELRFGLPLVSVVVTNFNYAHFLEEAVASVLAQSYPNVECIVVDDASTDDSRSVLSAIARREPSVKVVRHETNCGQSAAFRTGYAASAGEYVVFLDADDLLLPLFVETHIFVHLSLRVAVGFTSADMLQARQSRVVTSSWEQMSAYMASGRGARGGLLRRIDECAPDLWPMRNERLDDIERRVHFVDAIQNWGDWVYAPTSGNCFRRDALELFLGDGRIMELKFHGDSYLNKGVCLLSGAVLIDMPLAVYRIHGQNGFAGHPELYGVHAAAPDKAFRAEYCAWRAVADRLIDDPALFVRRIGLERYVGALVCLQRAYVVSPDFPEFENLGPYIETRLLSPTAALEHCLGARDFEYLLERVRAARGRQPAEKRRMPRRGLRHCAEFFLTVGRALKAPALSRAGEWLWHL